ncbi:transmembrane protein 205 isoform X1 [Symphalangus syndactylus]|uniref:transmembrane protein 205 isoform X1 n=1 Tax=Symphalangus syndactylus TaxID=9590 RepID=UPI0024428EAD|nr:transmembrane protein 205 isoform X1 [Symphalangus syndactylus]
MGTWGGDGNKRGTGKCPNTLVVPIPCRFPAFPRPSPTYLRTSAEQTLPLLLPHLHGLCLHQPLHLGFTACLGSAHILGGQPALPAVPEPYAGHCQRPLAGTPHHSCHVGPANRGEGARPGWGGTRQPPGSRSLPPAAREGPQVQCSPPEFLPLPWAVLSLQSGLRPGQWALSRRPCPGNKEPLAWALHANKCFFRNGCCLFFFSPTRSRGRGRQG